MKRLLPVLLLASLTLTGCAFDGMSQRPSFIAAYNVSAAADRFEVYRIITVRNALTDALIARRSGYCAVWPGGNDSNDLLVVCRQSDGTYTREWFGLANAVYSIEQPVGVAINTERRDR